MFIQDRPRSPLQASMEYNLLNREQLRAEQGRPGFRFLSNASYGSQSSEWSSLNQECRERERSAGWLRVLLTAAILPTSATQSCQKGVLSHFNNSDQASLTHNRHCGYSEVKWIHNGGERGYWATPGITPSLYFFLFCLEVTTLCIEWVYIVWQNWGCVDHILRWLTILL